MYIIIFFVYAQIPPHPSGFSKRNMSLSPERNHPIKLEYTGPGKEWSEGKDQLSDQAQNLCINPTLSLLFSSLSFTILYCSSPSLLRWSHPLPHTHKNTLTKPTNMLPVSHTLTLSALPPSDWVPFHSWALSNSLWPSYTHTHTLSHTLWKESCSLRLQCSGYAGPSALRWEMGLRACV